MNFFVAGGPDDARQDYDSVTERGILLLQFRARYYGSTMPICASISARALGEKSPVIVVMVSSLTKYSRS